MVKVAFSRMKSVLTNNKMSIAVRKRILISCVDPVLWYAYETNSERAGWEYLIAVDVVFEENARNTIDRQTSE